MITTFEQVLQMAPRDPYWRFRIAGQVRCNAPAIRFLEREGTYDRRYSCRLRQVIAETLAEIKATPALAGMTMLRQFRLSVTPITPDEWRIIREMGGDA